MENKINIAELLEDCPKGMELDCTMYDTKVFYQGLNKRIPTHPITVQTEHGFEFELTQYGQIHNIVGSKCVIFPKGKTTWEGFKRPIEDGDILATNDGIFIAIVKKNGGKYYCCCHTNGNYFITDNSGWFDRLATEEEKQKLFDAIKSNGYSWDNETKTLEKLPKFKVGNKVKLKGGDEFGIITQVADCFYTIKNKNHTHCWPIKKQDDWELVPNKFDISTLKPFESRVLVRDTDHYEWEGAVFGRYDGNTFFTIGGIDWRYCIPYEGNEHLYGTTNDCDDFYKTWEE